MAPNQQTLRMTGLPPAASKDDVQRHLDIHVQYKGRPSVVAVGPICKEPDSDTCQTTVTFSSTDAAQQALSLDSKRRQLVAVQGGAGQFKLDEHFRGMTTLQTLANPKTGQPDIDIVALHGLTGHAWNTFAATEGNGFDAFTSKENNWLQENLPRLLKQRQEQSIYARVMTFGYDADVWMTKSAADLDVPVGNLIWCLRQERLNASDRPLFFIGHSLGGIVIKEAIIQWANEVLIHSLNSNANSQMKYVFPVKGCLFFGVPHQGAKLADLASKFLTTLAKVFNVNKNIVHDLKPKSHRLARVSSEFEIVRSDMDLPVMSFYETKNLTHLTGLIVSAESAILDYPEKPTPFGIEKDHTGMVRFLTDNDQGLKSATLFLTCYAKPAVDQHNARNRVMPVTLPLSSAGGRHVEDRLSILCDYDTVFLIDDSPSMAGRNWELVKEILDHCTPIATQYDRNGIDIHFFNNTDKNQDNVRKPEIATQIHHEITLTGRTPVIDRIAVHLKKYLQGYKMAGYAADYKRYNLIVLTDGQPDEVVDEDGDPNDPIKPAFKLLQKKLVACAQKLDSDDVDAEPGQVGIQFCQIGHDKDATSFFQFLDDRLEGKEKLGRDMIDTIKCDSEADLTESFYRKLLIGAIDKREDKNKLEEQPAMASHSELISRAANVSTLPDRSLSAKTTVSRPFSEADTLVGPSRGYSFPMDPPLKALRDMPGAEGSKVPQGSSSSTHQAISRVEERSQASRVSRNSTLGSLRILSGRH